MPSVGHLAVGLAGARLRDRARPSWRSALVLMALATFPDLDVLFRVDVRSVWAHRGALHSLAVALAAAAIGTLLLGRARGWWSFLVAGATAASHGLLDCVTYGGGGVMLLWPLSTARFLAPWHPLPVSPVAEGVFTVHGFVLLAVEAVLFSPLVVYALRSRRPARRASSVRAEGRAT